MKIVVRFRYYKAVTPSCDIVELTDEQWREFLSLENATKRRDYMIALLERGFLNIKELWWIPLEDNMELKIKKGRKSPKENGFILQSRRLSNIVKHINLNCCV